MLMFFPVFSRETGGCLFNLFRKIAPGHGKPLFQRRRRRFVVFFPVLPQLWPGIFPAAGIGHVEHIAQERSGPSAVNDRDPFRAPPHIPAHPLVPEIIFRAGRRVGPLGVNEKLFAVRVFI